MNKDVDKIMIALLQKRKELKQKIESHAKEHAQFCGQLEGLEVAIEEFEKIAIPGKDKQ